MGLIRWILFFFIGLLNSFYLFISEVVVKDKKFQTKAYNYVDNNN